MRHLDAFTRKYMDGLNGVKHHFWRVRLEGSSPSLSANRDFTLIEP